MTTPLELLATSRLAALGQSIWLDYISRRILSDGQLGRMIEQGWITGLTSNPSIFEKAISGSDDYAGDIAALAAAGVRDPYDAFVAIASTDIGAAADLLRPVYESSRHGDGFVSLEIPPGAEDSVDGIIAEAERLFRLLGRSNLMIKVPSTDEGIAALTSLIAAGINVNMTLLFSVAAYERVAGAYIAGLEQRRASGQPLEDVASVASFFVSRLDTAVDALLPGDSSLRGKAAIANARRAYARFRSIFSGPRWERLESAGARVQRPLWASTGTKDPNYSDVLYVEELIAPHTVNTLPEATLRAFVDHGRVRPSIEPGIEAAETELAALADAGIDLDAITDRLLVEGLGSFDRDFRKMLDGLARALHSAESNRA